jgi:hypothetical protein
MATMNPPAQFIEKQQTANELIPFAAIVCECWAIGKMAALQRKRGWKTQLCSYIILDDSVFNRYTARHDDCHEKEEKRWRKIFRQAGH